jgi:dephospho-CoA kinase
MRPRDVPVVALIGGVGSGKSALAQWLTHRLRIALIDADAAGHRALSRTAVKEQVRRRFGDDVFDADGNVRRDRLAREVFGAEVARREAKRDLENIVHPVIREDLRQQIDAARQSAVDVVLLDAAVLLEAEWNPLCGAIVFLDTPIEQRRARVQASRGWSADELARREESQLPLAEKRSAADFVVDNSGTLDEAGEQLLGFLRERLIGAP